MSKKENPFVSVIMPVHNNEKYVADSIESILKQTYKDFEFIIIDDCSTDNSWKIIQQYAKKDKRIKAYKNKTNLKIVKTRNKGFTLMSKKTKYIVIFDSDDISLPKRIDNEVKFLEKNPEFGVVAGHTHIINENNEIIKDRYYETNPDKLRKQILFKSPIAQPACMIRKEAIDKVGVYQNDGKFDRSRDFDLWVRIADQFKIKNLDEFVLNYRISTTQGKRTHLKETIKSTIQIQKKWLFKKNYFSFTMLIRLCMEYCMLLVPNALILWIFEKIEYKKQ